MGLFDYVGYRGKCYRCGTKINSWQSKDGECLMENISIKDVRRFYTHCAGCGTWNEYRVIVEKYRLERVKGDKE